MPRLLSAAAAAMLAFTASPPAFAEVVDEGEGSFVTRDSVTVKSTPYETWAALIAPATWWNSSHTWSADAKNLYISAQGGGCFCELLPAPKDAPEDVRRGSAQHMTVILVDPPKALRMRGALGPLQSEPVDGVLTITLVPSGKGTKVTFEYVVAGYMRFPVPDIAKAVDGVMSLQLAGLAKLLGPAGPAVKAGAGKDAKPAAPVPQGKAGDEAQPSSVKPSSVKPSSGTPKKSVAEAFGSADD